MSRGGGRGLGELGPVVEDPVVESTSRAFIIAEEEEEGEGTLGLHDARSLSPSLSPPPLQQQQHAEQGMPFMGGKGGEGGPAGTTVVALRSGPSKAALSAHRQWLATASLRGESSQSARSEAREAKAMLNRQQGDAFESRANALTALGDDAANAAAAAAASAREAALG